MFLTIILISRYDKAILVSFVYEKTKTQRLSNLPKVIHLVNVKVRNSKTRFLALDVVLFPHLEL